MGQEVIAADTFIEHTGRVAAISITATSALLRS